MVQEEYTSSETEDSDEPEEEAESSDREDDEQTLSRQFKDILVNDRRVTPQFQRLTKTQYKLYKNALNVSP